MIRAMAGLRDEEAESLNRWFEENEQEKTGFGSLYHGQATDTELLQKYRQAARAFGEKAAAALICSYAADKNRMTAHVVLCYTEGGFAKDSLLSEEEKEVNRQQEKHRMVLGTEDCGIDTN